MIDGAILVGDSARQREAKFVAINPTTDEVVAQSFSEAAIEDVAAACDLANTASEAFAGLEPQKRAAFLKAVADAIGETGDRLIETAMAETGLPRARLEGERGRTIAQLNLFADVVRAGDWLDVTIDPAMPERKPAPRADLRRMNAAIGPVAVFGASNFPLAFSVAGGDTAAAFAAGCPVIVKGHPAHPGTGELVARAIQKVVAASALPAGVFSYLPGRSNELGAALVSDPRIKAVAFTGSRAGGLALVEFAAHRSEPIPVYAEMSSINPVILLPAALAGRAEALGAAFIASLTLGAGQFCTNPGLVVAISGDGLDRFIASASAAIENSDASIMLSRAICAAYADGVAGLAANRHVRRVATGKSSDQPNRGMSALFETSAPAFIADLGLAHEVFGASSLIVRCEDLSEMTRVVESLEGQLTATMHLGEGDEAAAAAMMPLLQARAGRILANGWPTGVEVTHAMVHGGPYPATSDTRTTSVGSLAMSRFLRPICFQDVPDALLPPALQEANPWNAPRRVDGRRAS